jgi:hypothetical protein
MNGDISSTQLLATVIPIIVTGVVAILVNSQVQSLKDQINVLMMRIAKLEQVLTDNKIPLPDLAHGEPIPNPYIR